MTELIKPDDFFEFIYALIAVDVNDVKPEGEKKTPLEAAELERVVLRDTMFKAMAKRVSEQTSYMNYFVNKVEEQAELWDSKFPVFMVEVYKLTKEPAALEQDTENKLRDMKLDQTHTTRLDPWSEACVCGSSSEDELSEASA